MNRPRPVLTSTSIGGLITAAVAVLAFLGYSQASSQLSGMSTALTAVGVGLVTIGSHIAAGLHAQRKVTPVASPQDHDGTPLVRAE